MKFTEGAFKEWGYAIARERFGATPLDGGPLACDQKPSQWARNYD